MIIKPDAQLLFGPESIVYSARNCAYEILKRKHRSIYVYHNLQHTTGVLSSAMELAADHSLSLITQENIAIAALFHDVGYFDQIEGHENIGAQYAQSFLSSFDLAMNRINLITELILATNIHSEPHNLEAQILRDADLNYLGSDDYFRIASNLREEWAITRDKHYSDEEWTEQNIRFLNQHRYFTEAARKRYLHAKENNIKLLEKRLDSTDPASND